MNGVIAANLTATIFLAGIAWFQQLVTLPLFSKFAGSARQYRRRNTILMSPAMAVEAVTAIWLWSEAPAALALLLPIWVVTLFLYIPLYSRLVRCFDEALLGRLVRLHWIRTLCWTARAALMLWLAGASINILSR